MIKNQYENKVNIAEIRMSHWMCDKTKYDKIRNIDIRESVRVTSIVEMMENKFRRSRHIKR